MWYTWGMKRELIRQAEAARLAGVTRGAIHLAIEHGQLTAHERYGIRLVAKGDVERLWPNGRRRPGPKVKA